MTTYIDSCLILLTYKGKVLLLQQDDILHQFSNNEWHFIEKIKEKNKSIIETIIQEVERETNIKLDSVSFILSVLHNDRMENLFHARLTDKNVNNIQRAEGRVLSFFTVQELKKLKLRSSTQLILSEYNTLIENLPINETNSNL